MNKAFCVLPWHQLQLSTEGSAQLCCRAVSFVSDAEGRHLRLDETPFDEMWNSDYMVSVRKDMLEGRSRPDCAACYEHEAKMGMSLRTEVNERWLKDLSPVEREAALRQLETESAATGHALPRSPYILHLWFGSHCNLKCRMCSASYSTRIASDPVHSRWHPARPAPEIRGPRRFDDGRTWADSPSVVLGDLLKEGNVIGHLSFAGGEPFLQPQIEPLLQALIDRGRAPHMTLYFSTNGTVLSSSLVEKLQAFKGVTLAISLDGMGALNDYIRHPSRWGQVTANLRRMQELPWLTLEIDATVQAYNALSITSLMRFCDAQGLRCIPNNVLLHPEYLSLSALPDTCRRLARERLQDYLETCPGEKREALTAVIRHLEGPPPANQPQLLATFLSFTGEMDASRSERLADAEPELARLVAEAAGLATPAPAGAWQRLAGSLSQSLDFLRRS
jgi:MoaA/NifB/PqqE/SkfB family radical SAM enzyme